MSDKKFSIELTPSVSIIIAGVIIAAAIIFVNQHPGAAAPAAAAAAGAAQGSGTVPAPTAADHVIGSLSAPIVLIEYSDFQCPYCQMIYPSLKDIVSKSNGQVAWVMREYPLYQIHSNAMPAAEAAECLASELGNDAFWKFADNDFANQSQIGPAQFAAEAQTLGADMTAFNACTSQNKFDSLIQAQIAEAQVAGGQGTPFTIVLNTKTGKEYPVAGALPEAQIQAVINQALKSQ
jgi:protein-disulfide isomerase